MDRNSVRKRATMMLDSDDEEEDTLGELPQPQSKKRREDDLASGPKDFLKALVDAGFYPRSGNLPNLLSVQQADFQHNLREHLTTSIQFPTNVEFFVSECDTFFGQRENFIKALHPTENASCETSNTMTLPQDSLVRLLLNIEEIQPKLLAAILKRFAKAANEEKPSATEVNLPSLILSQLTWLNRIVDPSLIVDTLLDLLNNSTSKIKKEIISSFPGMVVDREQIRVAFALCDMLNETNNSLTAAILDALGDLSLPSVEATELRTNVVKRLLAVPLETIPVLLTFVFKRIQPEEASSMIQEIRLNFDRAFKKRHEKISKETVNNCISLSVESLQNSMIRSKSLADTWLKEIQSKTGANDHHCVDVLVLVLQHKFSGRRRTVELMFRKKMRSEMITTDLVKETFQVYDCVLKNYFEQLCAIADSLILTADPLVISYGSMFFQEMFIHFDEFYQQEVVQALIQHVCCAGDKTSAPDSPATAAMLVFQELAETHWEHLIRFSGFIITLLEYIEYMALPQVKRVMELLAKMAYGFSTTDEAKTSLASFSASIQSELLMIIKKQLSHTRVEFQRMGVLGSVALVHVLANPELVGEVSADESLSQGASSLTITDSSRSGVLTGVQRLVQAKTIIDIVNSSTKRVPEVAALFMDEMASTSLIHDIHPSLHSYLYDSVSETFQEHFVVDEDEQPIDGFTIPLALKYGLDIDESSNIKLVFMNIAPMTIKEQHRKPGEKANQPTVTTLMSHFRLLRNTIDSFEQASLEDIDALLGCAVCIPADDVIDDFEVMSQTDKDIVCRCYFIAINWFIEVINTFARSKTMRAKVIHRLRDIVELKEKFYRCLSKNPSFMPPPCVFFGEPVRSRILPSITTKGKKGPGKKNGKAAKVAKKGDADKTTQGTPNKSVFHSTPLNSIGNASRLDFSSTQQGKAVTAEEVHSTYAIHFRELDLSAFVLLSSSLELTGGSSPSSVALKPKDLDLLLGDLSSKLDHKLLSSAPKRRFPLQQQSGSEKESFVMLDLYSPVEVAKRSVSLIRRLATHLETISGYFQQLAEMSDGILDGPDMFSELALRLGNSYTLIFHILNRILSWHEFQKPSGAPLLEDALKFIASRIRDDAKTANFAELHASSFTYVEKFHDSLTSFACAVEHVNLLTTLYNFLPDPDLSERLSLIAESFLKRRWNSSTGESEKGQKFNQGVEAMLHVYLLHGPNDLEKLATVVMKAMPEVLDEDNDDGTSETFKTCNKTTFSFYFRASFAALVEMGKKIPTSTATPKSVKSTLKSWAKVVELLNQLVATVRTNDKRSILTTCLKSGRSVVELFYKSAMPLLDKQFKNFPTESQELLKNLQTSTRILQNVCNHAKTSRDAVLAAHVPAMKKIQENLLYRVKAMLAANGCASAFWMGNLKNKNLKGQEITSQSVNDSSDDQELPNESSSDEEDAEDDDNVTVARESVPEEEDDDSRSREY